MVYKVIVGITGRSWTCSDEDIGAYRVTMRNVATNKTLKPFQLSEGMRGV